MSQLLIFRGIDGSECDEFIAALMEKAFDAGKIRDNQWIADYAVTCFRQNARRWYATLDEDVQSDWKLLQRAMLAEFPAPPHNSHSTSNLSVLSAGSIPTPAAAPPRSRSALDLSPPRNRAWSVLPSDEVAAGATDAKENDSVTDRPWVSSSPSGSRDSEWSVLLAGGVPRPDRLASPSSSSCDDGPADHPDIANRSPTANAAWSIIPRGEKNESNTTSPSVSASDDDGSDSPSTALLSSLNMDAYPSPGSPVASVSTGEPPILHVGRMAALSLDAEDSLVFEEAEPLAPIQGRIRVPSLDHGRSGGYLLLLGRPGENMWIGLASDPSNALLVTISPSSGDRCKMIVHNNPNYLLGLENTSYFRAGGEFRLHLHPFDMPPTDKVQTDVWYIDGNSEIQVSWPDASSSARLPLKAMTKNDRFQVTGPDLVFFDRSRNDAYTGYGNASLAFDPA